MRTPSHQVEEVAGFRRHELLGALRRHRSPRLAERRHDRVVVVEAEVARVVGVGGERDALRRQRALEGRQVQRLVVGDDAVEVEDERARPRRHGRPL